jgi:adenine-specific DNA-methyltransferase
MTETPERLDLRSHDVVADRREELLRLFPDARTEAGQIDFDHLRLSLGDVVDAGRERYGMMWPGKTDCFRAIQSPSLATLRPVPEESVDFDFTQNLIIEGDNLEVLKLLQKSYLGKVKMIYIDPPYNTGRDFIYPDDYRDNLRVYLEYTGQVDSEGRRFGTNTDAEGRFHSRWLNLMYPRLFLARNLLAENGVVMISIDDGELTGVRELCREIFGEENFIAQILWRKRSTPPNDKVIGANHDYIVVYAKNAEEVALTLRPRTPERTAQYRNPDSHPKGPWVPGDLTGNVKGGRYSAALEFPIRNPNTREEHSPGEGGNWRFGQERIAELLANDEIYFGSDGKGKPMLKRFLADVKPGTTWPTIWDFAPLNQRGTEEMEELLGSGTAFENPKPSGLMAELVRLGAGPDEVVLDFFAGSGSTAHGVLELNREDRGNRRFILVQLPEPTGREDIPTIAALAAERLRRVAARMNGESAKQPDSDDSSLDRGFRVFKLAESNFTAWDAEGPDDPASLQLALEKHVDHIRAGRSELDLLYEILLKSGYELTVPVTVETLEGRAVYSVDNGALLVFLDGEPTIDLVRSMAERHPQRVVMLDAGFAGNDQLKANAAQTFKHAGSSEGEQVVFRTV